MNRTYQEPLYDPSFGNISENNPENYDFVSWPASGYMLNEVFDRDTPWSISINENKYQPFGNDVEVKIKRLSDEKTWTLNINSPNKKTDDNHIDSDYFKISNNSNSGYIGEGHCLIFCPDPNELGTAKLNDSFDVTINGLKKTNGEPATLSYNVDFKGLKTDMREMDIALENAMLEYTGEAVKPKVNITYGGSVLEEGRDYTIEYNNNVNTGNEATATIKGKGDYEGEAIKKFTITPKKISLPAAKTGLIFSGIEQTGVEETQYYQVSNGSATNAGQHTATVSLKDTTNTVWTDGSKNAKNIAWSISQKSLAENNDTTITLDNDGCIRIDDMNVYVQESEGEEVKPGLLSVTIGNTSLATNDYDVNYYDNNAPRKDAKVILTGKGNYTGTIKTTFAIVSKEEFELESTLDQLKGELEKLKKAADTANEQYEAASEKAKISKAAAEKAAAAPGAAAVKAAEDAAKDAKEAKDAAKAVKSALEELQTKISEVLQEVEDISSKAVILKEKIDAYGKTIDAMAKETASDLTVAGQNIYIAEVTLSDANSALEKARADKKEADNKAAEQEGLEKEQNEDDQVTAETQNKITQTQTKARIQAAKAAKARIKGKALKKQKVQLIWKKVKNVSGFEVYQATKKKGKYVKVATLKKGTVKKWKSKKLRKFKKGKNVFYKIRVYTTIDGKRIYGKWSNVVRVKIKK